MKQEANVLEKPFESEESKDNKLFIEGVVRMSLDDIISSNSETFLDNISEQLIGESGLINISYKAVGADNGDILILAGGIFQI